MNLIFLKIKYIKKKKQNKTEQNSPDHPNISHLGMREAGSNHGHVISQNNQSIIQCHLIDLQDILITVD